MTTPTSWRYDDADDQYDPLGNWVQEQDMEPLPLPDIEDEYDRE